MKAAITLIAATAALGAVASPVDHIFNRRFTCEQKLDGFCHAPNANTRCVNGQIESGFEICKGCTC